MLWPGPKSAQLRAAKPSTVRRIDPGTRRNAKREGGNVAPSCTAASGGTRVARKAGRRLATTVTRIPATSAISTARRRQHQAAVRQREADGVEQREQPLRQPEAGQEPDERREHADDERLDQDRDQDLPARGADGSEGRELARSLGDRDRERVGDHEAADEERDPAESEQEAAQERDEAVRLGRIVVAPAGRPSSPARSQECSPEAREPALVRHARLRSDRDLVQPAGLVEQLPGLSAGRSPRESRRRSSRPTRSGRSPRSAASAPAPSAWTPTVCPP